MPQQPVAAAIDTAVRNAKEERPYTEEQLAKRVEETLAAYYAEKAKAAVSLRALLDNYSYYAERVRHDPALKNPGIPLGTRVKILKAVGNAQMRIRLPDGTEKNVNGGLKQWIYSPNEYATLPAYPYNGDGDDYCAEDDDLGDE